MGDDHRGGGAGDAGQPDYSARLAAELGLPFAFASHFAPDALHEAIGSYRRHFEPSDRLDRPRAMAAANVFAADTDAEARRLFTSAQRQFLSLVRGTPGLLPPPVETMDGLWYPHERSQVERMTRCSAVGSPETVRRWLEGFVAETGADEVILAGQIHDHAARLRSFELAAAACGLKPAGGSATAG